MPSSQHRGVAAEVLVGQEQHLLAAAVERPVAARRCALDDVQTVPPCRPVNALIAAEEFMYVTGTVTSATPASVEHVPGVLDLVERRPCRPSSSRRPGRAGRPAARSEVRMSALSAMKCTPQNTMYSASGPGRGLLRELERVAGHVGELDDLVALVVVAEDERPARPARPWPRGPARPASGRTAAGSVAGAVDAALGVRVAHRGRAAAARAASASRRPAGRDPWSCGHPLGHPLQRPPHFDIPQRDL